MVSHPFLCKPELVELLEVEPELRAGAEKWANLSAVSPVIARLPLRISVIRFVGTLNCLASVLALMSSAFSSSARCSPGWIAGVPITALPFASDSLCIPNPTICVTRQVTDNLHHVRNDGIREGGRGTPGAPSLGLCTSFRSQLALAIADSATVSRAVT